MRDMTQLSDFVDPAELKRRADGTEVGYQIPWSTVCRIFDHKEVQRRHPGWLEHLSSAAIFDLHGISDAQCRAALEAKPAGEMPMLPFPRCVFLRNWQIFCVDELWYDEKREMCGGNSLAIAAPSNEVGSRYLCVCSGNVRFDLTALALDDPAGAAFDFDKHAVFTEVLDHKARTIDADAAAPNGVAERPYRPGENDAARAGQMMAGLFWNMLRTLCYVSAPDHFVVERRPAKLGRAKAGQIPRLHSRPSYIVLDKQAIKRRYEQASDPSGRRSPCPHLRRGHYRTLGAERYKNPGQRVWVRAAHVSGNTVEWREGDRYYKVT